MSNRKIVSWTLGTIILGTGIWCLYLTAKSALLALPTGGLDGMPIDMRIMAFISSGVTMIFSCLFLLSGASSILRNKGTQINYYPTLLNMAMLIILLVLSVFALPEYRATSKISWEESRGLPFAFLTFTEIRGICDAGVAFWKCRSFENLSLRALIIDSLIVYAVICVSVGTLFELRISNPKRWLLKRSDQIKESGG